MRPLLTPFPVPVRFLLIGGIAACIAVVGISASQLVRAKSMARNNLFALVGNLNQTTGNILTNTRALNQQVSVVEGKLGELNTEENILQTQAQTGQDLAAQLKTQISLTQNNVSLMAQILKAEQTTSTITAHVSRQSQALADQIGQNADVLNQIEGTLQSTARESETLDGQMTGLLGELGSAEQEFRLFGQINQLLGTKSGLLGTAQSVLGGVTSGILKNPAAGALGNNLSNTVQGPTGGLLNNQSNSSSTGNSTTSSGTDSNSGTGLLGGLLGGGK